MIVIKDFRISYDMVYYKVLELGAGAGLCSIVLAALGANVVATDLAEGMKLLKRNIRENLEVVARNEGSVKAKILDWNSPSIESISFDVIVMIDVIYYLKVMLCTKSWFYHLRFSWFSLKYDEWNFSSAFSVGFFFFYS